MPLLPLIATTAIAEGEGQRVDTPEGAFAVFNLGGEFFVLDNTCTHGPGNLGDGFIENGEVECDFHQGRFSIRTGAAAAAPCIDPVRVWDVVIQDGQICIDPKAGHYAV